MAPFSIDPGQWLTLLAIASALGMDAFSLGIGIGMRGIRLLHILRMSTIIGLFHLVMPLMGMLAGQYMGSLLGEIASGAGGILLVLLGLHMVYSSIKGEKASPVDYTTFWGTLLFALGVSVDSLSVGVSLGLFATDIVLTVLLFGLAGGTLSILGLWLGNKVAPGLGGYGEAFGGVILFVFGIQFIF